MKHSFETLNYTIRTAHSNNNNNNSDGNDNGQKNHRFNFCKKSFHFRFRFRFRLLLFLFVPIFYSIRYELRESTFLLRHTNSLVKTVVMYIVYVAWHSDTRTRLFQAKSSSIFFSPPKSQNSKCSIVTPKITGKIVCQQFFT